LPYEQTADGKFQNDGKKLSVILALPPCAKREVMFFIVKRTAGQQRFPTTGTGILPVPSCVRFYGKYLFLPMSLWNCSKNFSTEENTPRGVFFIEKILRFRDFRP